MDFMQAFDECFDFRAFQLYWNSAYVECGYWWDGYVGGDSSTTTGGGTVWMRAR